MKSGVMVVVLAAACSGEEDGRPRREVHDDVPRPPIVTPDAAPAVRDQVLPALRGQLRDRRGEPLATNRPAWHLEVTPSAFDDGQRDELIRLLGLGADQVALLDARLALGRKADRRRPVIVLEDLAAGPVEQLRQAAASLPGVTVERGFARRYVNGPLAAHALGYMTRMSESDLDSLAPVGYSASEPIGRYGLEAEWENYLRGKPGRVSNGQRIEPTAGHGVVLTLDADLQRLAEQAVEAFPAAALVVVEIETGAILAIVSTPSFDPEVMTRGPSRAEAEALNVDPRRPFVDKVLRETYSPGKTFGFVTAIAAREDGVEKAGATAVGLDRIAEVATSFGFGASTGLGLDGDVPGRVPTRAWYEQRGAFRPEYTERAAAGQGDVEVTVLQVAMAYAALAGGSLYVPQLVHRVQQSDGADVMVYEPRIARRLDTAPTVLAEVRRGLRIWRGEPSIAGVAATVEVRARMSKRPPKTVMPGWIPARAHAWFAGYAPADAPEVAIAVLLPHAADPDAAPAVARAVLDGWWTSTRAP